MMRGKENLEPSFQVCINSRHSSRNKCGQAYFWRGSGSQVARGTKNLEPRFQVLSFMWCFISSTWIERKWKVRTGWWGKPGTWNLSFKLWSSPKTRLEMEKKIKKCGGCFIVSEQWRMGGNVDLGLGSKSLETPDAWWLMYLRNNVT